MLVSSRIADIVASEFYVCVGLSLSVLICLTPVLYFSISASKSESMKIKPSPLTNYLIYICLSLLVLDIIMCIPNSGETTDSILLSVKYMLANLAQAEYLRISWTRTAAIIELGRKSVYIYAKKFMRLLGHILVFVLLLKAIQIGIQIAGPMNGLEAGAVMGPLVVWIDVAFTAVVTVIDLILIVCFSRFIASTYIEGQQTTTKRFTIISWYGVTSFMCVLATSVTNATLALRWTIGARDDGNAMKFGIVRTILLNCVMYSVVAMKVHLHFYDAAEEKKLDIRLRSARDTNKSMRQATGYSLPELSTVERNTKRRTMGSIASSTGSFASLDTPPLPPEVPEVPIPSICTAPIDRNICSK